MKCPDCGSNDIVRKSDMARCINCGCISGVEDFAGEERMEEVQTEQTASASDQARVLIYNIQQHEEQKIALIASLRAERLKIDEALVALGAKRNRRKAESKKRGRPAGSKNKVAPIGGEAA